MVVDCKDRQGAKLPLRHDWVVNGTLALLHGVDFAIESHSSTSGVVR